MATYPRVSFPCPICLSTMSVTAKQIPGDESSVTVNGIPYPGLEFTIDSDCEHEMTAGDVERIQVAAMHAWHEGVR